MLDVAGQLQRQRAARAADAEVFVVLGAALERRTSWECRNSTARHRIRWERYGLRGRHIVRTERRRRLAEGPVGLDRHRLAGRQGRSGRGLLLVDAKLLVLRRRLLADVQRAHLEVRSGGPLGSFRDREADQIRHAAGWRLHGRRGVLASGSLKVHCHQWNEVVRGESARAVAIIRADFHAGDSRTTNRELAGLGIESELVFAAGIQGVVRRRPWRSGATWGAMNC